MSSKAGQPGITATQKDLVNPGDVVGPVSSIDNQLVRFDGVTGKLIQGGPILEDDAGNLSNIGNQADAIIFVDGTNNNTAFGEAAGNTGVLAGSGLVAIGANAAAGITTADRATCIGANAGSGVFADDNTFIGSNVATNTRSNSAENVVIGARTATATRIHSRNILIGTLLEVASTDQSNLVLIGHGNNDSRIIVDPALNMCTLGDANPGNWPTVSGVGGTAIGSDALGALTTGDENTGVGFDALTVLTTGEQNTGVGCGVGPTLATGSRNTLLGCGADTPAAATDDYIDVAGTIRGDATAAGTSAKLKSRSHWDQPKGSCYISTPAATVAGVVPVKAAGTTTGLRFRDCDMPATNRLRFTAAVTRDFLVHASLSIESDTANVTVRLFIAKNGVVDTNSEQQRKIGTANDVGSASLLFHTFLAQNDYVEVWLAVTAGAPNITIDKMVFAIEEI